MKIDVTTLVGIIMSAGGIAFVGAIVKGWADARAGARRGQREVVQDLMDWRDDLEDKLRAATADRLFWLDLAAQRGAQIRELGKVPAVPDPVPPSERRPLGVRRAGRREYEEEPPR